MKTIRTLVTTLALALTVLTGSTALASGPSTEDSEPESDTTSQTSSRSSASLEGQININTATMAELEALPGVGPAIAERIVSYRKDNPFKQRNQIMRVKGIGEKTFAKIKDYLVVEGDTTLRVVK
jgi:competence protein ComEA